MVQLIFIFNIIIVSFFIILLSNDLCVISVNILLHKPEDFKYMKIYVKVRSAWN